MGYHQSKILLINGSREEVDGITPWLHKTMPDSEVLFVPSIELAQWLLQKERFQMVVSSEILPDGSFQRLVQTMEALPKPPTFLVLGTADQSKAVETGGTYKLTSLAPVGASRNRAKGKLGMTGRSQSLEILRERQLERSLSSLGADIRNDLNNPLQEIVAMAFVARSVAQAEQGTGAKGEALEAINRAAQGMADVVNDLEHKIRHTIADNIPSPL